MAISSWSAQLMGILSKSLKGISLAVLVFVSDDPALIGYGYCDAGILVQNNTLTGKAAFEARIDGAVNKIFFLVGNFLKEIITLLNVNVTGGAGAYTSAVVVQMYIVILRYFQNRHILKVAGNRFRSNIGIFKFESYSGHKSGKDRLLTAIFKTTETKHYKYCSF
jgi:hypothetical protein